MKKSSDYGWNHPIDPTWEHSEYDGIKGFPPEWVPEPKMKEFYLERGCLFFEVEQEKVTYDEIKSRFDWMMNEKERAMRMDIEAERKNKDAAIRLALFKDERTEYDDSLSILVGLFKDVSHGEIEGLRRLGGDIAVMGANYSESQSDKAKKPRKLEENEIRNIMKIYAEAKKGGSVYGVVKELARKYNVVTKTISNVVKDLAKK